MNHTEFLGKQIDLLKAEINDLVARAQAGTTAEEVRDINSQLEARKNSLAEFEAQLETYKNEEKEQRGAGVDPMASFAQNVEKAKQNNKREARGLDLASMEYRQAFMEYVQRGTVNSELIKRAGGDEGFTVTADIGMLIPETVMNEIIQSYKGVYGTIYSKVRKLNIKGGVKFPIGDFNANFHWINEESVSPRQKAGDANTAIEFSYYMGEIRVANSLLSSIVSLPVFETEIANIIVRAFLKEMDSVIINGDGNAKPWGITQDSRVTNRIEFTEAEFDDWKEWRKKLFSVIPLGLRGGGEFIFPASTVESHLATMHDDVNRPLYREATDMNLPNSGTVARFYGRDVQLVEPDIIPDFDTAEAGDVIGVLWNPNDYAINTNMQFAVRRYFDEETNQWISKALVVLDGKILDAQNCYLLVKAE